MRGAWLAIRDSLVPTVLVTVAGHRIARVGGIQSVVVNWDERYVAIDKTYHTFRIIVEGRVGPTGSASVPRQRSMRGPFHHQQCPGWIVDRRNVPPADVRNTRQVHPVEDVARVVVFAAPAKRLRLVAALAVTAVIRAGKHLVPRRRSAAEANVTFDF